MTPFDYVKSISETKMYLMNSKIDEKDYNGFIINKSLSFFIDTILYSNEMNMMHQLDKKMQYDYYLNSIPKKKRFSKWHKAKNDEYLNALCEYYHCSIDKAKSYIKLLPQTHLDLILEAIKSKL